MNTVPLVLSVFDTRNASTITFYGLFIGLLVLLIRRKHITGSVAPTLMALSTLVIPFIPASNFFFYVGFVIAERILYLPSMGFCLLVAIGFQKLQCRLPRGAKVLLMLGLVTTFGVFALKTRLRNQDWQDELSLYQSGLRVTTSNAKILCNVGHALESKGEYQLALRYFEYATTVQQDDVGAVINVGRILQKMNQLERSELWYRKAKAMLPTQREDGVDTIKLPQHHLNVFVDLAQLISRNESRLDEADILYRQAISMREDYTQAYINLGSVLVKLNRTQEALKIYEKALTIDSYNADLFYNMGVIKIQQNDTEDALKHFEMALKIDPDHQPSILNSAVLIHDSKGGNPRILKDRMSKASKSASSFETADTYFKLGMHALKSGSHGEAEKWLREAIELRPDFRSALFNLALLLSQSDSPETCEPVLRQLLRFHPEHTSGLILLGDVLVNQFGDLSAAEDCYRRILEVDSGNTQAHHNLCVVMFETGRLLEARDCFLFVSQMAPDQAYIEEHLRVVEAKLKEAN